MSQKQLEVPVSAVDDYTHLPVRPFPTLGQSIFVLFGVAAVQLAASFLLAAATGLKEERFDAMFPVFLLLASCGSALFVLLWARSERRESLRLIVVPKRAAAAPLAFALLAILGADVVLSQLGNYLRWLLPPSPFSQRMLSAVVRGGLPLAIANVVLAAPVCEELVWRGVVLRGFLENYRPRLAIFLSALLFAVIHFNARQGVPAFFTGCLLAWFVARTGSLIPAIAGHALVNGIALIAYRSDARIPGITAEGFQPWWFTTVGVLLATGGLISFSRATSVHPPGSTTSRELPPGLA